MKILLVTTLGLLGLLVLSELLQILLARAPRTPRSVTLGPPSTAATTSAIPKVIWSYWHPQPAPEFIERCWNNWRRLAPDHELRLLSDADLAAWIDPAALPTNFDTLPSYRRADWLRIQLLARHGGIWIDASTLLTTDLEWVHRLQQAQGCEYVGQYIDRYTTRPEQPMVENWFMAAVPGSRFAADLAREFDHALALGAEAYLAQLQAQGNIGRIVQGLDAAFQRYLLMHVAASALLDRMPGAYRLCLLRAEDSALSLHTALRWRKRHLYARLALCPWPGRLPALIKLRGGDRKVAERGLSRGWLLRGSALARCLELQR
jgi:hypothetical protein